MLLIVVQQVVGLIMFVVAYVVPFMYVTCLGKANCSVERILIFFVILIVPVTPMFVSP